MMIKLYSLKAESNSLPMHKKLCLTAHYSLNWMSLLKNVKLAIKVAKCVKNYIGRLGNLEMFLTVAWLKV